MMSEWLPIDSAPKSGSFLVYGGEWVSESKDGNDKSSSKVAHVNKRDGYRKLYIANSDEFWPWVENPTHWMPLPESPK